MARGWGFEGQDQTGDAEAGGVDGDKPREVNGKTERGHFEGLLIVLLIEGIGSES